MVINEFGMPFNDVGEDRLYSSDDWRTYFNGFVADGVIGDIGNELQIKQQIVPNKTIKIETGSVFLKGAIRQIDTVLNLNIADNTSGNPRIDRIVARLNIPDRKIEFVVKQGTPSSSPTAPALSQTEDVFELSLARIAVSNGFSAIITANITDERTFMTYRDRVVNDRMAELEGNVEDVNARMDDMDPAKFYGKYSQMSGGIELSGSAQSGIVTFSKEDNDDFSAINLGASNSRITIPQGITKVQFYWKGELAPHTYSPNTSYVKLYKNGVEVQPLARAFGSYDSTDCTAFGKFESTPISCAAGDYFQLYAQLATDNRSSTLKANSVFGMEVLK